MNAQKLQSYTPSVKVSKGASNEGASDYAARLNQIVAEYKVLERLATQHELTERSEHFAQRARDVLEPLIVMVVGPGNAGKSSLVNALLGRDLARVGRVPTSWTIDIFKQRVFESGETAVFRFRDGTSRVESLVNAPALKEELRRERGDTTSSNLTGDVRTSLVEVEWHVDVEWPDCGVALVDTAGLLQDRSDVARDSIQLWGAEGIEVRLEDPFTYFFRRADLVLWCTHAGHVDSVASMDILRRTIEQCTTHVSRPPIVGIVTAADRLDSNTDQQRALTRCSELYAGLVDNWRLVSTRVPPDHQFGVRTLREVVRQQYVPPGLATKIIRFTHLLREDTERLISDLSAVATMLASNAKAWDTAISATDSLLKTATADFTATIESIHAAARARAEGRVAEAWKVAADNLTVFGAKVAEILPSDEVLRTSTHSAIARFEDRINAGAAAELAAISWHSVRMGSDQAGGSARRVQTQTFQLATSSLLRAATHTASLGSGMTTSSEIIRGSGALLDESVFWLPVAAVGTLLGGIGKLFGGIQARSKANSLLNEALISTQEQLLSAANIASSEQAAQGQRTCDAFLQRLTGQNVTTVMHNLKTISESLSLLMTVPQSRHLLLPSSSSGLPTYRGQLPWLQPTFFPATGKLNSIVFSWTLESALEAVARECFRESLNALPQLQQDFTNFSGSLMNVKSVEEWRLNAGVAVEYLLQGHRFLREAEPNVLNKLEELHGKLSDTQRSRITRVRLNTLQRTELELLGAAFRLSTMHPGTTRLANVVIGSDGATFHSALSWLAKEDASHSTVKMLSGEILHLTLQSNIRSTRAIEILQTAGSEWASNVTFRNKRLDEMVKLAIFALMLDSILWMVELVISAFLRGPENFPVAGYVAAGIILIATWSTYSIQSDYKAYQLKLLRDSQNRAVVFPKRSIESNITAVPH